MVEMWKKGKGLALAPLVTSLFLFFTTSANMGNEDPDSYLVSATNNCWYLINGKTRITSPTCGDGDPPTPKIRFQK